MASARDRIFDVVVPVAFLAAYMGLGIALIKMGVNSVVATLATDGMVIVASLVYVHRRPIRLRGDGRSVSHARIGYALAILLLFVWLFGQVTAVWVYQATGDATYTRYESTISGGNDAVLACLSALLTVIVGPIAEEGLMRGVVFSTWSRLNPWVAIVLSSVVFALCHGTVVHFIPTFLCGMLMALAYATSGRIWVPMVMHVCYNLGAVVFSGVGVADVFFLPGVFGLVDVALVVWMLFEFGHVLACGHSVPSVSVEVSSDGEKTA